MKITVLAENTAINQNFAFEHGLSLFIEAQDKRILFDFGQTDLFWKNAEKLNIDLKNMDFAILSHGHYDHGGGIPHFLSENGDSPIYVNENAFGDYYNGTEKYIGLDKGIRESKSIILTGDEKSIGKSIRLYSCNNLEKTQETNPFGLKKNTEKGFTHDDFLHEQYLLIEEKGKKFLFSGCSHKGLLNIMEWFKPDYFIGGFHFSKIESETELSQIAQKLLSYDTKYFTCHCTGLNQYQALKSIMGDNLDYLSTGKSIVL